MFQCVSVPATVSLLKDFILTSPTPFLRLRNSTEPQREPFSTNGKHLAPKLFGIMFSGQIKCQKLLYSSTAFRIWMAEKKLN